MLVFPVWVFFPPPLSKVFNTIFWSIILRFFNWALKILLRLALNVSVRNPFRVSYVRRMSTLVSCVSLFSCCYIGISPCCIEPHRGNVDLCSHSSENLVLQLHVLTCVADTLSSFKESTCTSNSSPITAA